MKRIWFLDNLRTIAVLLGIVCTIIIPYSVFPSQVYVISTRHWAGFDVFYEGAAAILLAALFFISGYLGASDLRIHLIRPFLQKKWIRLGWPWLFGVLFFAPELAYISYLANGGASSFIDFYIRHFWIDSFTQGPFWFLSVLILLFLVLAGAKKWHHDILKKGPLQGASIPLVLSIISLQALLVISTLLYSGMTWFNGLYIITFQPVRMITCALYFFFGIWAFKHRWFSNDGYTPSGHWIIAGILFIALYALAAPYMAVLGLFMAGIPPVYMLSFLASFLSLPSLLGLIAFLQRLPHSDGPTALQLSNISYPFYFLSAILIENTAYLLHPLSIDEILKVMLIVLLSAIYGYLLCKYVLWHLPCFKKH